MMLYSQNTSEIHCQSLMTVVMIRTRQTCVAIFYPDAHEGAPLTQPPDANGLLLRSLSPYFHSSIGPGQPITMAMNASSVLPQP